MSEELRRARVAAFKEWFARPECLPSGRTDAITAAYWAGFEAAWNAPALTWTDERPTVPGWYWMTCPLVKGSFCGFFNPDDCEYYPGYSFAGPIPEPAEPAKEGGG